MSEHKSYFCPLCLSGDSQWYHRDKYRTYYQCNTCELVFVPKQYHLNPEQEKAEYDKHQNDSKDLAYRKFLSRTLTPLLTQVSNDAIGLDFGCGPGPTIAVMAAEQGVTIKNYDLYYFNAQERLKERYDFITMTEVIEHIAEPNQLLQQLDALLREGAILAIMTKLVISLEAFKQWHYKNDPTHICFYSIVTFEWISRQSGWRLQVIDKDVVFFHKD